ncbi:hypothetical protein [Streptomyces sp. NPDC095817]|uniref:hypothetical protein n=1 Tax=Streptomyces sp. NPDC095817 TaxID=3155082 RepID=UPI00332D8E8D
MNLIAYAVTAWQQGFTVFPCSPAKTTCPQSVINKQPHLVQPDKPYIASTLICFRRLANCSAICRL